MQIFTDEFKNFLKQMFICSWKGHKKSKWMDVWWAPGHSSGYQVKVCNICNKKLASNRDKSDLFKVELRK